MHAEFNSVVLFTVLYSRFQHCAKGVSTFPAQPAILESVFWHVLFTEDRKKNDRKKLTEHDVQKETRERSHSRDRSNNRNYRKYKSHPSVDGTDRYVFVNTFGKIFHSFKK